MKLPCVLAHTAAEEGITSRVTAMRAEIGRVRGAEVEGVHDMRVASRRLRAALQGHLSLYHRPAARAVLKRARTVTQALGIARELDVCIGLLDARKASFQQDARYALHHVRRTLVKLRAERVEEVMRAAEVVDEPQFEVEMSALMASGVPADTCYLEHASGVILDAHEVLCDAHQKWRKTREEEDLHEARIAFKKLRYHCELYDGLYGPENKAFIKELKGAQEALGDWNDCRVLRDYARACVDSAPPSAARGMPRLLAELDKEVIALLEQFDNDARRFFSKTRQRRIHAFYRWPTRRCCLLPVPESQPRGSTES